MAEQSAISWCDSTQNFWLGCDKIGPACDFCYAESWAKRAGMADLWAGRRQRTKTWNEPMKWERGSKKFWEENGRRRRVFTCSLADFFDNAVPPEWRIDAWKVIHDTPSLEWYIVTKRLPNVGKMLPEDWESWHWLGGPRAYDNVVLIITVVTQEEWNRDEPRLKAIKKRYPWLRVGLSIEPMLGRIELGACDWLDWVIVGGESGSHARYFSIAWPLEIAAQCHEYAVPFHFKQIGNNPAGWGQPYTGKGDKPGEWPPTLRDQQFPRPSTGG